MRTNFIIGVSASVSLAAVMVGCGGAQSQFIKAFSVKFIENDVQVTTEFAKAVPLNMELEVPVKNYGTVKLIPASGDKGFQIQTTLNSSAWIDKEFLSNPVNTLPSGAALPSFVSTSLGMKNVYKDKNFAANMYVGSQPEKKYLGASLELAFLGAKFPASLTLTQKIVDSSQREIGAVTLYGPKVDNGVVLVPGGLFFVTDVQLLSNQVKTSRFGQFAVTSVTHKIPLIPYDGVDVSSNDATTTREYKKPQKLLHLYKLFNISGREGGLID
jgi:hypothetical protein